MTQGQKLIVERDFLESRRQAGAVLFGTRERSSAHALNLGVAFVHSEGG